MLTTTTDTDTGRHYEYNMSTSRKLRRNTWSAYEGSGTGKGSGWDYLTVTKDGSYSRDVLLSGGFSTLGQSAFPNTLSYTVNGKIEGALSDKTDFKYDDKFSLGSSGWAYSRRIGVRKLSRAFDRVLIDRVFSDADVIDVDFSEWDKQISLWVLADHWSDWRERKPLVAVRFKRVTHFSIEVPISAAISDDPESHLHWHVYESAVETIGEITRLRVEGLRSAPKLTVECRSIELEEHPIHLLDTINPEWSRPAAGLARLSILKMAQKSRGR